MKMQSNHLFLEEPIRMASILEPSKAVNIFVSYLILHVFIIDFSVILLLQLKFAEIFRGNDKDRWDIGPQVATH